MFLRKDFYPISFLHDYKHMIVIYSIAKVIYSEKEKQWYLSQIIWIKNYSCIALKWQQKISINKSLQASSVWTNRSAWQLLKNQGDESVFNRNYTF